MQTPRFCVSATSPHNGLRRKPLGSSARPPGPPARPPRGSAAALRPAGAPPALLLPQALLPWRQGSGVALPDLII